MKIRNLHWSEMSDSERAFVISSKSKTDYVKGDLKAWLPEDVFLQHYRAALSRALAEDDSQFALYEVEGEIVRWRGLDLPSFFPGCLEYTKRFARRYIEQNTVGESPLKVVRITDRELETYGHYQVVVSTGVVVDVFPSSKAAFEFIDEMKKRVRS